jgi:hypothetical protein
MIFEYKESLRMLKTYFSAKSWIERYHAIAGKNQKLPARAKALANERLAHVYGTKLFIQDAKRLWQLIKSWKDRADQLVKESGLPQRAYKDTWTKLYPTFQRTSPFPVFGAEDSYLTYSYEKRVYFRGYYIYYYSIPALKGFLARLAQLCDTFGVHLDAGIAWDAIPYTFVVDWFINVGGWLHRNVSLGDWYKVDVHIEEYFTSVRALRYESLSWSRPCIFSGGDGPFRAIGTSELFRRASDLYRRERALLPKEMLTPAGIHWDNKAWSLNRIINATSLSVQRYLPVNSKTIYRESLPFMSRIRKKRSK